VRYELSQHLPVFPGMEHTAMQTVTRSIITCPRCGASAEEEMPLDACLYFYRCTACGEMLRPRSGDCCVFCSFGTNKCPPVQQAGACCAPRA